MYTALYRTYRPEVFDQLLGQEHIARILKNQIASDSTSHAYLFCGTRGTGKTTTARLLAKGLNCLSEGDRPCGECAACRAIRDGTFLDVIEIDAASNRGIDDIRQLRESVNYPPAVGRNKVYIIDEVHMLSTEAFNALLKTLEEPPEYVTFILATTEPRKLPATILSRCLRLDFKRIPETVLIDGMKKICQEIGIEVTDPALRIIAANADGSVRDGLSILDQCIAGGDSVVDAPQVLDFLGASGEEVFLRLTDLVSKRRTGEAIEYLASVLADGKDVRQLIRDWVSHYRNLMMTRFIRDPQGVINLSVENIDRVREQSSRMGMEEINRGILELSKTADQARWSTQPRILLEVCIVNLCQGGGVLPSRGMKEANDIPAGAQKVPKSAPSPAGTQNKAGRATVPAGAQKGPERASASTGAQKEPEKAAGSADAQAESGEAPDPLDALIEAAKAQKSAAKEQTADVKEQEPAEPAQEKSGPAAMEPDVTGQEGRSSETRNAAGDRQVSQDDLQTLWDEVFADGEQQKGSIYLIRSNGMLTDMDEGTFTVTVRNQMARRQTERTRDLLEELMEARTGQHRRMLVEMAAEKDGGEISVEEAAARASDILGTKVTIE